MQEPNSEHPICTQCGYVHLPGLDCNKCDICGYFSPFNPEGANYCINCDGIERKNEGGQARDDDNINSLPWVKLLASQCSDRMLIVDGHHLYLSTIQGTWASVKTPVGEGVLWSLMQMIARGQGYTTEVSGRLAKDTTTRLNGILSNPPTDAKRAASADLNRHPLFEFKGNNAIGDFRTGGVLDTQTVQECLMEYGSLPRIAYDPSILDNPPLECEIAHKHYGDNLFSRIAYLLTGVYKTIDVIRMPVSDSGKSTLAAWVTNAIAGGVETLDAYAQLKEREFSPLLNSLASRRLVFLDEADKITDAPPVSRINELTSDTVRVHNKFRDEMQRPRIGNAVLMGADWPAIQTAQGNSTRFQWAWDDKGRTPPMDPTIRNLILTPEAASWLGTLLVDKAAQIYQSGQDASTPETRDAASRFVEMSENVLHAIMRDVLSPGRSADDFVPSADIVAVVSQHPMADELDEKVEKVSKTQKWGASIRRVSPGASPKTHRVDGKVTRGWSGLVRKAEIKPTPLDVYDSKTKEA